MSRIALVAGGVSGIGAATARQLKRAGDTVVASVTQLLARSSVQLIASAVCSVVQLVPGGKSRAPLSPMRARASCAIALLPPKPLTSWVQQKIVAASQAYHRSCSGYSPVLS